MRKGIVALTLVMASLAVPATPALAGHCTRPFGDPVEWVKYIVCQLSHR